MESDLPLEVLEKILSHLDPLVRLSAGLVCKRWLHASAAFLEDVCLTIYRNSILATGRLFSRIIFHDTDIDDVCIDYINSLGQHLLYLQFICCRVSTEKKAVACIGLRTLKTDSGHMLLIFTSLPRLQELDLEDASNLTDHTLMAFDRIASLNLEVFAMPDFQSLLSSSKLLEAFVKRRTATLTTLRFPVDFDSAVLLSRVDGLKLRSVSFSFSCGNEEITFLLELCRNQPGIVVLNLKYMEFVTEEHVAEICNLLPALREFSASDLRDWSPLFSLRNLRMLSLGGFRRRPDVSFLAFIPMTPLLELRILHLNFIEEDFPIHVLLSHTPRLVELNLNFSDVSDATLAHACPLLTRLRVLQLRGCRRLSDMALRGIRNLEGLVRLDLSFCYGLTNDGIANFIHFRHLRQLDLERVKITSSVLESLRAHNPCLTKLRLD